MPNHLRPLMDLLLYGNFWIAACASMQVVLTYLLLDRPGGISDYAICLAGATLALYGLHRTVGLRRVTAFQDRGRYAVITRYRYHIYIYTALGALVATYYFFQLSLSVQVATLIPAMLSLGYVLPILGKGRRLRDVHYIKIFLVAIVWAYLTVYVPCLEAGARVHWPMMAERALFVFGLTLPFDIRDMRIDQYMAVRTLPRRLGLSGTRQLIVVLYLLCIGLAVLGGWQQWYSLSTTVGLIVFYLLAGYASYHSHQHSEDYYFTGLLDGMLLLEPAVVGLAQNI